VTGVPQSPVGGGDTVAGQPWSGYSEDRLGDYDVILDLLPCMYVYEQPRLSITRTSCYGDIGDGCHLVNTTLTTQLVGLSGYRWFRS
jgi:hypothetical protein